MIKDFIKILFLVSDLMQLEHPIIQDIRYLFCSKVNDKCWGSREEWNNVVKDWHYSLKQFLLLTVKDKYFRQRIIKVLQIETDKLNEN